MKREVSRLALLVAALVFGCFLIFLLGVSLARDTMNSYVGPLSLGVWLLLAVHVLPVVFGIVHMNRANPADLLVARENPPKSSTGSVEQ